VVHESATSTQTHYRGGPRGHSRGGGKIRCCASVATNPKLAAAVIRTASAMYLAEAVDSVHRLCYLV